MIKFKIKKICTIFFCISSFTAIADNKLTIEPLLDNVLEIPKNEHRLMAYQVTNHDTIDHSFQLKPITGVTQLNKNPTDCQFHQVLQANQSCILKLKVSGTSKSQLRLDGPALCDNQFSNCIKPKKEHRLTIERVPEGTPMISVSVLKSSSILGKINPNFSAQSCRRPKPRVRGELAAQPVCGLQLFVNDYTNETPSFIAVTNPTFSASIFLQEPSFSSGNITLVDSGVAESWGFDGVNAPIPCQSYEQTTIDGTVYYELPFQESCAFYYTSVTTTTPVSSAFNYVYGQYNTHGSLPIIASVFDINSPYPCSCTSASTSSCSCTPNSKLTSLPTETRTDIFTFTSEDTITGEITDWFFTKF